jgi:hypothetical protein
MAPQPYELLYEVHNPVEADILADLLASHEVDARVLGSRDGNLIGVGQNILAIRIEVPVSQREAAAEVLEAFLREDGAEQLRDEGLLDDDDDGPVEPTEGPPPLWSYWGSRLATAGVVVSGIWGWSAVPAALVGCSLAAFGMVVSETSILRARGTQRRRGDLFLAVSGFGLCLGILLWRHVGR